MSAKAVVVASCDARAMRKAHPKLPHLRAWREHFGKTQEWVAEQVSRAHSNVVRWESGQAGVDNETFAAIAKAYGITVAELTARPRTPPKLGKCTGCLRRPAKWMPMGCGHWPI